MKEKVCCVFFGKNKAENLALVFWGWMRGYILCCVRAFVPSYVQNFCYKISFLKRYFDNNVHFEDVTFYKHEKVFYALNREAINITNDFYREVFSEKEFLLTFLKGIFKSDKIEAYFKKEFALEFYEKLRQIYLFEIQQKEQYEIILFDNKINRFLLSHLKEKKELHGKVRFIWLPVNFFLLPIYYLAFLKDFFKKGFAFNQKRKYFKVCTEASSGFLEKTLRDDLIVDDQYFKKEDLLLIALNLNDSPRREAYEDAGNKGYHRADLSRLPINITGNSFELAYAYLFSPVIMIVKLWQGKKISLMYYFLKFLRNSFYIENLMNSYQMDVFISCSDHDDIVPTIVMNKYGAKTVLFNWGDLACFSLCEYAFIVHNLYLPWGEEIFKGQNGSNLVDVHINVGCIYKERYSQALRGKGSLIKKLQRFYPDRPTVVFFDTSFGSTFQFTGDYYLEFISLVRDFCLRNKNINVILKSKNEQEVVCQNLGRKSNAYLALIKELHQQSSFWHLEEREWGFERALALADICVGMGMASSTTVPLVCGKDAFYYDNTGNTYHPFARKYRGQIVFDDKESLFLQIDKTIKGEFSCSHVISENDLRAFDAYPDDLALPRIRECIRKICEEKRIKGTHGTLIAG